MIRRAIGWIKSLLPTREIWKPVVGYEGLYEVSDQGRIKSLRVSKKRSGINQPGDPLILRLQTNPLSGRLQVRLHNGEKGETRFVRALVLAAFVGPCPPGKIAGHVDADASDNRLPGLRWITREEAQAIRVRLGLQVCGERVGTSKLTTKQVVAIRDLAKGSHSQRALARQFGLSSGQVSRIVNRKIWREVP